MKIKYLFILFGLALGNFIQANPNDKKLNNSLEIDSFSLDQVVVTATRTPKALKDAPVVTQVITADDIRKSDATNIQDLLIDQLPGLEFSFAMTQETSLNMNGFGGSAVLFLIDGERLAGETMDNVDYSRLNLENIGRVEIVKGASSALYGANAVGGVVNLISREYSQPWTVNVNSRYRSLGSDWRNGVNFSFNSKKWNSQTSFQHTQVNTVQLTDAFDTQSNIQQIWGGHTINLKERLVFRATDHLKFIARGSYFVRECERSNYTDHYKDYTGGLKGVYDFGNNKSLEISYAYDQYDKARFISDHRTHDHDYSNQQHVVHALLNLPSVHHVFTVGADYLNDYLLTYQFMDNHAKRQYSLDAFAQYDYNPVKWFNAVGSLRHDYFSASDAHATTARLATMFKWTGFSIRSSYAGGFRAPTLKELYMSFDMAGMMMIYGNERLKPERSHNYNIAIEHYGKSSGSFPGSYSLTLTGYCNKYDKRITTDTFDGDSIREAGEMYCNDEGVTVLGIDFSARYRLDMGLGAVFNYNYLHASANSIQSQFSKPRPHTMTWRMDYDKQFTTNYSLSASLSGRYLSKPLHHSSTCGAYSIWKLSVQQQIMKAFRLSLVIDNLLNYKPTTYYWNSPTTKGITLTFGLSIDIDQLL